MSGTHSLEIVEEGTCEEEKTRPGEGHLLSGDSGGRDLPDQGEEATERGALTSWRRQRKGLVRTKKGSDSD